MKLKICSLALSLLPLALVIGCEKKVEEPAAETTTATEATPAEGTATPAESTATPEGTTTPEAAPATPPAQ